MAPWTPFFHVWRLTHVRLYVLLAALGAPSAHAACESGLADRMQARLYPGASADSALSACKAWPAYPGRSIVVLAFPLEPSASPGQRRFDLAVLLIQRPDNGNTDRDAVVAQTYQAGALREDGAALQELRIDTAHYTLRTGQRGFGLRARYRGDDLAAPWSAQTLRLYFLKGNEIRQVLAETEMDRDSGRWDLQCNGQFVRLRTQLQVGSVQADGWAPLILARTTQNTRSRLQADGQCIDQRGSILHRRVHLQYTGDRYVVVDP